MSERLGLDLGKLYGSYIEMLKDVQSLYAQEHDHPQEGAAGN